MVLRLAVALILAMVALTACHDRLQSQEKVQAAIIQRLQKSSGLDLNGLTVTTTSVKFDKNMAYATVSFHPKDDPAVNSGMSMKYTLEERNGQWVVVNVSDSQGHGLGGHGAASGTTLPPGHPAVDGTSPSEMPSPRASGTADPSGGRVR